MCELRKVYRKTIHSPSAYLSKSCALSLATAILVSLDSPCILICLLYSKSQASDRWRQRKRDIENVSCYPIVWSKICRNAHKSFYKWTVPPFPITYLAVNPINLCILILKFWTHVESHISQVSNHCVNLTHIFFHLVFTSIVGYPRNHERLLTTNLLFKVSLNDRTFRCIQLEDQGRYDHP
jgi:hypothetical protein